MSWRPASAPTRPRSASASLLTDDRRLVRPAGDPYPWAGTLETPTPPEPRSLPWADAPALTIPATSCPPTVASAGAPPRSARRSSRRLAHGTTSWAPRTARRRSRTLVGRVRGGLVELFGAARRLRGRARQRRLDRVLGRRDVLPDRGARRAPAPSASSARSSPRAAGAPRSWVTRRDQQPPPGRAASSGRRGRRRRLRLAAQRDLDRRDGAGPARRGRRRRRARPRRRDLGRRRPAGRHQPRPTSTTSRRRSTSPRDGGLWFALMSAGRDRARRAGSRRRDRWIPEFLEPARTRSTTRGSTRPTTRRPSRRCCSWRTSSTGSTATAASTWAAARTSESSARPLRLGRADRRTRRRSSPTRRTARTSSSPSTSTTRRRRRGREDPARQRHRRHRALPQARPQPAARRDVPGHRPGRRRGAHRLHRLRGRPTSSPYEEGPRVTSPGAFFA